MGIRRRVTVEPSAARLTSSLRDVGYEFPSAVADLVGQQHRCWSVTGGDRDRVRRSRLSRPDRG